MSSVAEAPIARTGSCRLRLVINGVDYSVRPHKVGVAGARAWRVKKLVVGGGSYLVVKSRGSVACTCPDHAHRGVKCKHIGALIAAGLLSRKGVAR